MNDNGGKRLMLYWPVIIAVVMFAVGWGSNRAEVSANDKAIKRHEQRIEKLEDVAKEQAEATTRLDERTKSTQRDVGEIKMDVKTLLHQFLKSAREKETKR